MTDYLEELLEGADALREQLRRLEQLSIPSQTEGTETPPSTPEYQSAGRRTEEAGDRQAAPSEEGESAALSRFWGMVEEDTTPVEQSGEALPGEWGAEEVFSTEVEREVSREAEPLVLLSQLERLERASAALEGGGLAPQEQSGFQGGSGTGSEYPMALSKPGDGSSARELEVPAGWSWQGLPDSAQETSGGALSLAEQTDQAFRRDSRRYDGGFFLY